MKRLSCILAALAGLAIVSCARSEQNPPPRTAILRHLVGDPSTLDPTTTTEETGLLVEEMIFRPLVGIDAARHAAPALAASWTVSPDGLTYEFHLDPRYTWENGSAVTSDDVRYTIERVRNPKVNAATWSWGFEDLAAIETPDAATIRFRFSKPYAERLIAFSLPIVSAVAFGRAKDAAETDRKPVGSGPYRLESWESNQKLKLVRREGKANANGAFDDVIFRVIPEGAVRYPAGMRGELDEFRLTREQRKAAEASKEFLARFRTLRVPQFLEALLIWNCRSPFLSDPRVRLALAHSWERAETAKSFYPPDGALLVSGPYPPGAPENPPGLEPPSYDPALSARLLDEAGWKVGAGKFRTRGGARASVELLFPAGQAIYTSLGEVLRTAYEKVGVEFVLRPLDWAAFSKRAEAGEFDAQLTARVFLPPNLDPYPFFHSGQWPPKGQNLGYYKNAEADRVMEAARAELDPAKRLELYRQVARIFAADPPADFLWGADQFWAMARRVEGVETSPVGLFHFLPGPLGWHPATPVQR